MVIAYCFAHSDFRVGLLPLNRLLLQFSQIMTQIMLVNIQRMPWTAVGIVRIKRGPRPTCGESTSQLRQSACGPSQALCCFCAATSSSRPAWGRCSTVHPIREKRPMPEHGKQDRPGRFRNTKRDRTVRVLLRLLIVPNVITVFYLLGKSMNSQSHTSWFWLGGGIVYLSAWVLAMFHYEEGAGSRGD
jgi:hypothetical protein